MCLKKKMEALFLPLLLLAFQPRSTPRPFFLPFLGRGPAGSPLPLPLSPADRSGLPVSIFLLQPPAPSLSLGARNRKPPPLPRSPTPLHPRLGFKWRASARPSTSPPHFPPLLASAPACCAQPPSPELRRDPPRATGPNRAIPAQINRAGELYFFPVLSPVNLCTISCSLSL